MNQPKLLKLPLVLAVVALVVAQNAATGARAEDASQPAIDIAKIFAGEVPTSVEELRAMQAHVQQLAKKVIPCTVGVRVGSAQGSGVIITEDGYVLTAGHVVGKPNQDVVFVLPDGSEVKGKTLGMNRGIDSGLMKIDGEREWPHLEMGKSADLKEGQWIIGTGHPGGYETGRLPVLRMGRILSANDSVIVTDSALVGGDSGGPLFDMDGKVIGIHSRIGGSLAANMHVPVDTYQETWDRLAKAEAWGNLPGNRPFIGVVGDQESNECKIAEVYPGTPAEKAGVQVGDVIIKFDGKDITDFDSLRKLVAETNPGNTVKIVVRRGEETEELKLKIGRRGG